MSESYPIPPSLRYHPPNHIEVVAAEQHCLPGCPHLRESWRKGFEAGARAERERIEGCEAGVLLLRWGFVALMVMLAGCAVWDCAAGR